MPSRNGDGGGGGADANATKWRPVGRALRVARREDARDAMGIRIADRVAMGMIRADDAMNLLSRAFAFLAGLIHSSGSAVAIT